MSVSGYPIELEDREYLNSLQGESPVLAMRGTYQEVRLDARQILTVENQGPVGSCAGHSLSSILEWIYAIATGGERVQLSRAMAYFETQRQFDGIRSDQGSTIGGGVKLAKKGICRESLWIYPGKYDNRRPSDWSAIEKDAENYKISTEIRMTSYEGVRTFLGAGLGGVHSGWNWNETMEKPVVETFQPRSRDGGHSEAVICLSTRVDSQGRPYVFVLGSWGTGFANKGWQEFSPTAVEQMLRHPNTAMVGLSDMPNIAPRKFNIDDWRSALRA